MSTSTPRRSSSGTAFDDGKRRGGAAEERVEMAILRDLLPTQLDDAAVTAGAREAIAATGAASQKDMGKVIAALKQKYAGQMDFGKASGIVKGLLQ